MSIDEVVGRMDPDLASAVRAIVKKVPAKQRDVAILAIAERRKEGTQGQFSEIVSWYQDAVDEAITAPA